MRLKINNSYLITNKIQLKEFFNDLNVAGFADKDNDYILNLGVNKSYIRITITMDGHCVHGNYPKDLPLTTEALTAFQHEHTPYKVTCQRYRTTTHIKYNKEYA